MDSSVGTEASRAVAQAAPVTTGAWARARQPAIPLVGSALVLASGLFSVAPLRDASTLHEAVGVQLARPLGYVLLAPLSDTLDALTLLSARQDEALVLGLIALWALFHALRSHRTQRRLADRFLSLGVLLSSIAVAYAAALLLPRPMAYLSSLDPDVVRVDFHSHTGSSHDARHGFTVEESREWHRAGGYDVAYVTDHGTFTGAERGLAGDARDGSSGTILLSGIEANWNGEHVGLLGSERSCRAVLSNDLHDLDARGLALNTAADDREPILVWNHPRDPLLERLPFRSRRALTGIRAVEISNGAPYSVDLLRPKRERLVQLARRHDLAMLSGTDNHGWGRTAPNWTLLNLKGWRRLDRRDLARGIERTLRDEGSRATRVIERTRAEPGTSRLALSVSVLTVPWRVLTTLSPGERLAWLAWLWIVPVARSRGRALRLAPPAGA